jgi:hypothetical protein
MVNRFFWRCCKKGYYYLKGGPFTAKSVQIIGLETGVHIDTGPGLQISPISVDNFEFEFNCERNITVHFENVASFENAFFYNNFST